MSSDAPTTNAALRNDYKEGRVPQERSHVLDPDEDTAYELSQRLDYDGVHIRLKENTTYILERDNVWMDADNVTIEGPESATIKLADGTVVGGSNDPALGFRGAGGRLEGWTFDGNVFGQNDDFHNLDRYGLRFGPDAQDWTLVNHRNTGACGDAYGNVRGGTDLINCYANDFVEDGIDFWANVGKGVRVIGGAYEGYYGLKVRYRDYEDGVTQQGDLYCSGVRFHGYDPATGDRETGDGIWSVLFQNSSSNAYTMKNFTFHNCRFTRADNQSNTVRFAGSADDPGSEFRNVEFNGCYMEGRRPFYVHGSNPVEVNELRIIGGKIHATGNSTRAVNIQGPVDDVLIDGTEIVTEGGTWPYVALNADASNVSIYNDDIDEIRNYDAATNVEHGGVRGGGVMGGIDLSATSGYTPGQQAKSDGTATGFPAGTLATWDDAGGQWVRADGQATATPA